MEEGSSRLIVHGVLKSSSDVRVNGSLHAERLESIGGDVTVKGDLEIDGEYDVGVESLAVGGTAKICGGIFSSSISIGGLLTSNGDIKFEDLNVGGRVEIFGNCEGRTVNVGGTFKVSDSTFLHDLNVGGGVWIGGGCEVENMDVGGRVMVDKSLKVNGMLNVGGNVKVKGELTCGDLDVGGGVEASKLISSGTVEIGGYMYTEKGAWAEKVIIRRRGRVKGSLSAKYIFAERDSRLEDLYGGTIILEDWCEAGNIYGEHVKLGRHCKINGRILYKYEVDLSSHVELTYKPEKVDRLPQIDIT